ncbi:MAG TPA: hypothetical protein VHE83_18030 [Mycobacteriales bacterium]|nr:hypothetical protein [Mycobacteriales bacterium]
MRVAVDTSCLVNAPRAAVWSRIGTPDGINDELSPLLKMTVPRHMRGRTLDDVPVGRSLGRSWLLFLRVIPFDYDRLMLAERDPGARFLETSTMATARAWRHERSLTDHPTGTIVHDKVAFDLRAPLRWVPGYAAIYAFVLRRIFAHRHHRIRRFFG